jgi:hypothetical protein
VLDRGVLVRLTRVSVRDGLITIKGGRDKTSANKWLPLLLGFDKAVTDARVEDFQFRDFRHNAWTRYAANGLPLEGGDLALGHKLRGMAGK